MLDQKKIKYILLASIVVLLASNIIALRAIGMYRNPVEVAYPEDYDIYKGKYEELQRENEYLKTQINKLEKPAEKWDLFEKRHGKTSRSDSERDLNFKYLTTHKRMRATAYTEYECDKDPDHPLFRITTSGNEVEEWFTAAAGPELPFGTRVYIPYFRDFENHGIFVVEDRGGAIKENCIDIYMTDQETVNKFGVKQLDVYIIHEGFVP